VGPTADDYRDSIQRALGSGFQLREFIAQGGFGTVYAAWDVQLEREVAVKALRPDFVLTNALISRFKHEARILAKLRHPNIVPVYTVGGSRDVAFFTMPRIKGESLDALLRRAEPLAAPEISRILREAAAALHAAHDVGIVHRDMKPENILLEGPERRVLVMDFGIAKALQSDGAGLTASGLLLGTPSHMSPEQAAGAKDLDARSDVYALGVVGYQLCAGEPPFTGPSAQELIYQHIAADPIDLTTRRPDLPPGLTSAIMRALSKSPADRFQTVAQFAEALTAQLSQPERRVPGATRRTTSRLRGIAVALGISAVAWGLHRVWAGPGAGKTLSETEALNVALPDILRLTENGRLFDAYQLAIEAERVIPENAVLHDLWPRIARYTSVHTVPGGATVELRPYDAPDHDWLTLGVTPLDAARIPTGFFRWRLTLSGYHLVEMASSGLRFPRVDAHEGLRLARVDEQPEGMVRVPGGELTIGIPGLFDREPVVLGGFLIDRYEVTNRAYKAFVDAGGYRNAGYWTDAFVREGRILRFEDAVQEFVDATGRPGPATWLVGDYPDGQAENPVVGISWFEASAYARYAGKELPTLYHWHRAAGAAMAAQLLSLSNFGSGGLAPVGTFQGMGPFGTYDMAGNAKEWVWNAAGERRYLLGGAWDEPAYLFREAETRSPWDRSANNGVRLMMPRETVPEALTSEVVPSIGESRARQVTDQVWLAYAALYAYDRAGLETDLGEVRTAEHWTRERVSYRAAYGEERIPALLFLPKGVDPPYQAVVAFPGSGALTGGGVEQSSHPMVELLVKAGRAVLLPVYQGTYERATGLADDNPDTSVNYRDHVVMWSKDLGRSIDYLESRDDIDGSKLAYYGVSWGAGIGPVLAAVEPRLTALVLQAGGFWNTGTRPEADQRVLAPRVRAPVLMLNGNEDPFFPLETSQLPMFHALGAADEDKRHVVYESGHSVPQLAAIGEILAWLDRYLGPVR
jgi:serine/threonine protein kinase/formylglycine-generating enzyme required for sulfatase activity/dienelactone hydrolase